MKQNTSLVLKTDGRGRVRTPLAQREALVAEFERSGVSAARFAAMAGIKYQTFCHWVQKHRATQSGAGSHRRVVSAPMFVEAFAAVGRDTGLRLRLPGGCEAQIGNVQQAVIAAALVRELGKGGASC